MALGSLTVVDVTTERAGGVAVVVVRGPLEAAGAGRLQGAFDGLLAAGDHEVVVDLSDVPVIDGTGLATLVEMFKRVRIGPGDVRLCGVSPLVDRALELTHLDRVFEVFTDREAAVASFESSSAA